MRLVDYFSSVMILATWFASIMNWRSRRPLSSWTRKSTRSSWTCFGFKCSEIQSAALRPGEDEEVEQQHQRATNSAKLLQLSQTALDLLSENENSMLAQGGVLGRTLQELQRVDPGAATLLSQHEQVVSVLQDLQAALSRYMDKVDIDPGQLRELEERLNLLNSLKRKVRPCHGRRDHLRRRSATPATGVRTA